MDFSEVRKVSKTLRDSLAQWQRELHRHPEVGLDLPLTRKVVLDALGLIGLKKNSRQFEGGIVVDIAGEKGEDSPAVALRVDMDALPIAERTGLSYASSIDGYMHACGHDAHTAIGLGVAAVLQKLRARWLGSVRLLFQSGEEMMRGAKSLLEQGVLDSPRVAAILGLHLDPHIPEGSVGIRSGQVNAWVDEFSLIVTGKAAHGAAPHHSVDPVVAFSFAVQAFQTIVSRNVAPGTAAVISVGRIGGGRTYNIIPECVSMDGTVRSLNPDTRELIHSRMDAIAKGIENAFGVEAVLTFRQGAPPVVCDEALTEACLLLMKKVLKEDRIKTIPSPKMGGDDFAFLAEQVPGCMIRLGTKTKGCSFPLHSSRFCFKETVLEFGTALFSYLLIGLDGQQRRAGYTPVRSTSK
jgi:amidohydrolase